MYYFVYCNKCAFKMLMQLVNAPARWWHCACLTSVSCLRRLEKKLFFWDAYMSLTWCSNMVDINEGNWLQLLFYFLVLMGIVTAVIGIRFFSAVFHVLEWSILLLHFDGNVCNWFPKVIWPRMDWFWGVLLGNRFSRRLHICMDWNLQEMLNCYSILTTSIFFDV